MANTNNSIPQPQPLLIQPTLDKAELLQIVTERCPGAEMQGDWLLYRKNMLRLTIEFGEMRRIEETYCVQLLFIVQHPWFDEDMVETVDGFGGDPDDAMRSGTEQFCTYVMPYLMQAFDCKGEEFLTADLRGHRHTFRIPEQMGVLHTGEGQETDLFAIVKDALPSYLGTKRCYWVKLYSSVMNGNVICGAMINGTISPGLTELLYKEIIPRRQTVRFSSDKEFVLLIQNEDTWKPCPFTKQEVGELVFRAFKVMQEIKDENSSKEISAAIRHAAPNLSVGTEIVAFLPEVLCQQVVQFMDNEHLMPVVNYGKPDCELKKSQVRSYGYIEDAIFQYLRKQKPTQDEINQILAMSGKFHAISEGIRKGIKLEALKLSQLVYFVDESYEVW